MKIIILYSSYKWNFFLATLILAFLFSRVNNSTLNTT